MQTPRPNMSRRTPVATALRGCRMTCAWSAKGSMLHSMSCAAHAPGQPTDSMPVHDACASPRYPSRAQAHAARGGRTARAYLDDQDEAGVGGIRVDQDAQRDQLVDCEAWDEDLRAQRQRVTLCCGTAGPVRRDAYPTVRTSCHALLGVRSCIIRTERPVKGELLARSSVMSTDAVSPK